MRTGHVIEAANQDTRRRRVTRVGGQGFLLPDTKFGDHLTEVALRHTSVIYPEYRFDKIYQVLCKSYGPVF